MLLVSWERLLLLFRGSLLLELGNDLLVPVEGKVLHAQVRPTRSAFPSPPLPRLAERTSSPILTPTPPNPGITTRSPALTETGMILPSALGAPGPTARTTASGGACWLAAEGRYSPEAVFWTVQPELSRFEGVCEQGAGVPRQP